MEQEYVDSSINVSEMVPLKLCKISEIYCGRYLNLLFKFSFVSCYGAARVWERTGRVGRERETVISFSIGLHVHDVSARKLCDWLVEKSPHFLLPTA